MSKLDELAKRRGNSGGESQGSGGGPQGFVDPDQVDIEPGSGPSEGEPPGAGVSQRSRPAPRKRARASSADGRPRKSVNVVYVSEAVKKRFDAQRHRTKKQSHQLVLEAISKQRSTLAEIVAGSKYSTAPVDDLFPQDPKAIRYLGGGSSQIHYNLTPEQDAVLDDLTAELGFGTRSTWIAPVLNAYLGGRKEKVSEEKVSEEEASEEEASEEKASEE